MAKVILKAQGVRKQFFRKGRDAARYFDALVNTDLELVGGELVACMGRSGSGKSTLLNILAGLLEPTEGTVDVCEQDLYALADTQRSRVRNSLIGVAPQGQTAIHSLTVQQNVMLPLGMYGSVDSAERQALDLLEKFGMRDLADSYPAELSGGEGRRMAIARALATQPKLLLADEPTADLDDVNTKLVLEIFRNAANEGAAVLVVTHEQGVRAYADRLLRMDAGVLVEEK